MGNARPARIPENIGRIDHVVMLYRTQENQEAARLQFAAILGIADWDDMGEVYERVHVIVSWKSGIELIRPTRPDPVLDQALATRGEGFYALVFGVANLDDAIARVVAQGGTAHPLPPPPQSAFETFAVAREAVIGEIGGVSVTLGEFKPIRRPD